MNNKGIVVRRFEYNGFCGQLKEGNAPYTAKFVEWTRDPGVAWFMCSDGKKRLIPTFALVDAPELPPQVFEDEMMLFGCPCCSDGGE